MTWDLDIMIKIRTDSTFSNAMNDSIHFPSIWKTGLILITLMAMSILFDYNSERKLGLTQIVEGGWLCRTFFWWLFILD